MCFVNTHRCVRAVRPLVNGCGARLGRADAERRGEGLAVKAGQRRQRIALALGQRWQARLSTSAHKYVKTPRVNGGQTASAEAMDMALTSSMSVGKRSIISTILEVCPMFRLRGTRHMCVFRAVVLQHFKMLFRLARRRLAESRKHRYLTRSSRLSPTRLSRRGATRDRSLCTTVRITPELRCSDGLERRKAHRAP